MEKPVRLRLKPIEVEAIQYNGKNTLEIFEWIKKTDPEAVYQEGFEPFNLGLGFDGSSVVRGIPYLDVYTNFGGVIRIWQDLWVFKSSNGRFSTHDPRKVVAKYDQIWPEPLPEV